MRYRSFWLLAFLPCLVGTAPGPRDPGPDPLDRVIQALAQGRHWHAARLLSRLDAGTRGPRTDLLAARADGGRGAWSEVARRLQSAPWLDSLEFGEGRALRARAWLETGHPERAVRDYHIYLGYAIRREDRALAELSLARALTSLRRGAEAAAAYGRAIHLYPAYEPWLAGRAAEAVAPDGDTVAVRRWLDRAVALSPYRRASAAAEAMTRSGDSTAAVRTLLETAQRDPRDPRTAQLRVRAARILLARQDTGQARSILRAAVRDTPGDALEAAELLALLPRLRAKDHLALARAFERSGAPGRAVPEYRRYLAGTRSLASGQRERLRLKIGELLYRTRAYTAAADVLDGLAGDGASASVAARAEYLIARIAHRRGRALTARRRYRAVADRYPDAGSAAMSLWRLGDMAEGDGRTVEARATYEELARRFPWTGVAGRASFRLGTLAYLEGDYAAARRYFDICRRRHRSRLLIEATYWAARARTAERGGEVAGDAERLFREVHRRDPFGYYGLLAAERIGIDPWTDLPPGPDKAPIDEAVGRRLDLIRLLRRAGLEDEARAVLDEIVESAPAEPERLLGLARALAEEGFGAEAIRLGWQAHVRLGGRWSTAVLEAIYPLAYTDIILAESRTRRLDPYLVAALVRQESAFAPDVTSRAGARGLLQLMPRTGRYWAGRVGVRPYRDELLFHPETNVHLGAAFFADLHTRYRELQLSLVGYNAGPTRARRWRDRPAYRVDPELFVERVPFSETRNYLRGVQRHVRIYRHLYPRLGIAD